MPEIKLIEDFFESHADYTKFFVQLHELAMATDTGNCMAWLTKEDDTKWLYELSWKDDKYVAEYVVPFLASEENVATFNRGSREIARRLKIYIETDDSSKVPSNPPAFEHLSCETDE
jgi:hypothetical protein